MQVLRENKLKCLASLLAVVFLVTVVAIAAIGGPSAANRQLVIPREPDAARRTFALLSGIPQHGPVLGYPEAPVTLQFFGDLQCPQSRQAMIGALPFLIRRYVRTGELQIRFRSREVDTKGAGGWYEFREQQVAAMVAGAQDKLWNFISVFYREQGPEYTGYVDEEFLKRIAQRAGLALDRWLQARNPPQDWVPQLLADEDMAIDRGLDHTPAFLIGRTGGAARQLRHFGLDEPSVFEEAVEGLL
jgi:protein-disulfide isomerase